MIGLALAPGAATTVTVLALASALLIIGAILTGRWSLWVAGILVGVAVVVAAFAYSVPPPADQTDPVAEAPAVQHGGGG